MEYREIITIIVIILLIVIGHILVQNYLKDTSTILIGKLEEVKQQAQDRNNEENAKKLMEETKNEWENINKIWTTLVLHQELDLIETAMTESASNFEVGEIEEGIVKLDTSIFLLDHIKDRESLKLKNIF